MYDECEILIGGNVMGNNGGGGEVPESVYGQIEGVDVWALNVFRMSIAFTLKDVYRDQIIRVEYKSSHWGKEGWGPRVHTSSSYWDDI